MLAFEPARTVRIAPEPFDPDSFDVWLEPPPRTGQISHEFRSYRRARGFAEGLALALGLNLRDTTGRDQ